MSGILKSQSQKHGSSSSHVGFDKVTVAEVEVQNSVDTDIGSSRIGAGLESGIIGGDVHMHDVNCQPTEEE